MTEPEAPGHLRFFFERKVAEHMSREIRSIPPASTLRELGRLIERFDYNAFPVVNGEKPIGVVTKFDFMKAFAFTEQHLIPDYRALMDTPVGQIMSADIVTVSPEEPLTRVLQKMVRLRTRSFPVIDGGKLVGMISRTDIIAALKQSTGAN
jgi:CBS domain-containing protein